MHDMETGQMNHKVFRVSRWIFQEITETLSERDREQLLAWRKEHPDNERVYRALKDRLRLSENLSRLEEIDVRRPMEAMYRRIYEEKRRIRYRSLWRWVSVAAVVAIFAGSFYLLHERKQSADYGNAGTPVVAVGEGRVMLRLGDGRMVGLDTLSRGVQQGNVEALKTEKCQLSYVVGGEAISSGEKVIYNEVLVPRSGNFSLVLADGTTVWVNAESRLRYPVVFNGKERKVYLEGEAYFSVAKDSLHPFVVETEKMDVTVLGTQFNVNTYRVDGCYETTLVEGKVEVCDRLSKKEVVLLPDEQARLQGGNLSVRKVDTRLYTSWVNGRFYFEREALEEIAAQLERWYDVSFFFMREELKQEEFTGVVLRDYSLEQILEIIAKTTDLKFTVNGKAVTLQ